MNPRKLQLLSLLLLRLLGVALQLLVQVVVGRLVGPAGLGVLQLFTTWTCVLGEGIAMGRPTHAMKTLSVARQCSSVDSTRGYVLQHVRATVKPWLGLLLVAILVSAQHLEQRDMVLLAAAGALVFALLRLFADGQKALGAAASSVFAENSGAPLTLLAACSAMTVLQVEITPWSLLLSYAAGFILVTIGLAWLHWRRLETEAGMNREHLPIRTPELLPLWGTGLLSILFLQFPFIFLPLYSSADQIGQFALAFKLVNLVSTILILLAALYGPRFARDFASGDVSLLRQTLWESQLTAVALYGPAVLLLAMFMQPLLGVFGDGFDGTEAFLWILLAGQLVNAATGLPGLMLNMSGAGKSEFYCLAFTLLLASIAALLVGPGYGASGIALVYSAALACKNIASWWLAQRMLAQRMLAQRMLAQRTTLSTSLSRAPSVAPSSSREATL